jgi:drug/metabolite transporter (DMT)-like permease
VFGFPLFTALALHHVSSAHGAVVVGLLSITTAAVAVIRGGERPSAAFWSFALAGALTITLFAALESGTDDLRAGNAFALVAVILGGLGYAEGGALAREFGGTRVIAWTLVLASPLVAPIVVSLVVADGLPSQGDAWLGLAYLASVSAFLGFIPWYSGLARGGIARVGQVQLLQPLLTLLWSAWLLNEHLSAVTAVTAVVVIACIAGSTRSRIGGVGRAPTMERGDRSSP